MVGLATMGELYLEGEVNVELYPRPRHPRDMERPHMSILNKPKPVEYALIKNPINKG